MTSFPTRRLTRSGLALSEIGLGCATLAFDSSSVAIAAARATLKQAYAGGIRYFDTAPLYGTGLSEHLLGGAAKEASGIVISTKVGRLLVPDPGGGATQFRVAFEYTYDGIMRSFEHSQQRLGRATFDILYGHDLGRATHGEDADAQFSAFFDRGGYRAMEELRNSGLVKAIGLGVNETDICLQAMQHGHFDLFLLAGRYTLLERKRAQNLLEACSRSCVDIVIGGPFNSGMLVGGTTYNYRDIPAAIKERRDRLLELCRVHDVEIGAAALQFPFRSSVVKSVIPGPRSPEELKQIFGWTSSSIPGIFWSDLENSPDC